MHPITQITVNCIACKWQGRVIDCEPDDEGSLHCPHCGKMVLAAQAEQATFPATHSES